MEASASQRSKKLLVIDNVGGVYCTAGWRKLKGRLSEERKKGNLRRPAVLCIHTPILCTTFSTRIKDRDARTVFFGFP